MNTQKIAPSKLPTTSKDFEEILVIARQNIFQNHNPWQGIMVDYQWIMPTVVEHHQYMMRGQAENDIRFKQIIPYIIFMHNQQIFVMQRKSNASENRLAHKFSIGIGGHMNKQDTINSNLIDWAMREFHEEVNYDFKDSIEIIGLLNDETNLVGQVHLGIIMIMHGSSSQISIQSEHKSGKLLNKEACLNIFDSMESWSQICLQFLINNNYLS